MRKFDDNEPIYTKRKAKRAPNKPGEGMRILNKYADDFDELDLNFDDHQEPRYNKTVNTTTKRFN